MATKLGEYKGSKTITLYETEEMNDRFPFTFGVKKAGLILENLDAIKAFVEENKK